MLRNHDYLLISACVFYKNNKRCHKRETVLIPTIIDIEASGFGRGSYPIEIGYVDGTLKTGCTLIKPLNQWTHWNTEAEQLHGISRELLFSRGRTIAEVAAWLNEIFNNQTVYSDGWVNDMCWLGKLFNEAEMTQTFKIESILMLLTEDEKELWSSCHEQVFKKHNVVRHRASSDAKIIQKTFIQLKK